MDKRGFKTKTIVKNIQEKINDWLPTIKDDALRARVKDDYILTGGAIASMLVGDLPNDYDLYFKTPEVARDLANYYIKPLIDTSNPKISKIEAQIIGPNQVGSGRVRIMLKSVGVYQDGDNVDDYAYFEGEPLESLDGYLKKNALKRDARKKYNVFGVTSNAITLYEGIQIITRFTGSPEDIHKNYDFVHCTNYYTERTGLVLNQPALEAILAQELKYIGSVYPIASMFRLRKFIKRGWSVTVGEMLKIAWDINKLRLDDPEVLEEQLVGVDYAYFREVIDILRKEGYDVTKPIDRTYLFETINRVFDEADEENTALVDRHITYQDRSHSEMVDFGVRQISSSM